MPRRKRSAIATFEKVSVAATEQTLAIYNMGWDPESGEPMSAEHAEFLRSRNITPDSERAAQNEARRLFNKPVINGLNRNLNRKPQRGRLAGDSPLIKALRKHPSALLADSSPLAVKRLQGLLRWLRLHHAGVCGKTTETGLKKAIQRERARTQK
jgi:hypothetical protein